MRRGASLPTRGRRGRISSSTSTVSDPSSPPSSGHSRTGSRGGKGVSKGSRGGAKGGHSGLSSAGKSDPGQADEEETESEVSGLEGNRAGTEVSSLNEVGDVDEAIDDENNHEDEDEEEEEDEDEEVDVFGTEDSLAQPLDGNMGIGDGDNLQGDHHDKVDFQGCDEEGSGKRNRRRTNSAPTVACSSVGASPVIRSTPSDRSPLEGDDGLLCALHPTEGTEINVRVVYGLTSYSEYLAELDATAQMNTSRGGRGGRGGRGRGRGRGGRGRGGRGGRGRGRGGAASPTADLSDPLAASSDAAAITTDHPADALGTPGQPPQQPSNFMGDDGNLFYCHACHGVGDVVCCDGCPRVYHPQCLPPEDKARLEEDPWYCPDCYAGKRSNDDEERVGQRKRRSRSKQRCAECLQSGGSIMGKCEGCGVPMHVPSCRINTEDETAEDNVALSLLAREEQMKVRPLCTNCRAESVVAEDEEEMEELRRGKNKADRVESSSISTGGKRKRGRTLDGTNNVAENASVSDDDEKSKSNASRKVLRGTGRGGRGGGGRNRGSRGGRGHIAASPTPESNGEEIEGTGSGESISDDENNNDFEGENSSLQQSVNLQLGEEDLEAEFTGSTAKRRKPGRQTLTGEEKEGRREERKRIKKLETILKKDSEEKSGDAVDGQKSVDSILEQPMDEKPEDHGHVAVVDTEMCDKDEEGLIDLADGSTPDDDANSVILSNLRAEKPTRATPGFFFFLDDNRLRIERHLTKRDRAFKAMKIGSFERNEMIAREGAIMWLTSDYDERKRYTEMSLNDFEARIIAWKEEEHIRAMLSDGTKDGTGIEGADGTVNAMPGQRDEGEEKSQDDARHWRNRHSRLFSATQIRCRPHEDTAEKKRRSRNRILLDLLHDCRFHPLPMIDPTRSLSDFVDLTHRSKMTVPFFTVQGPVSTGLGDECLGCQRGWNHFCPVLKRQFPAVEHRAKLQPPVASLLATRIGLGGVNVPGEVREVVEKIPSTVKEIREQMRNPSQKDRFTRAPSCYLSKPNSRCDDIVHFIEAAAYVKVSDTAFSFSGTNMELQGSPSKSSSVFGGNRAKFLSRGLLPTRGRKRQDDASVELIDESISSSGPSESKTWECGRCDSVSRSPSGCISCRRSHLVAEMARHGYAGAISAGKAASTSDEGGNAIADPSSADENEIGYLTFSSIMLGREPLKYSNFERQKDGDRAIAAAVTTVPWKPNVVLPQRNVSSIASAEAQKKQKDNQKVINGDEQSLQSVDNDLGDVSLTEAGQSSGATNGDPATRKLSASEDSGERKRKDLFAEGKIRDGTVSGSQETKVMITEGSASPQPVTSSSPPSSRLRSTLNLAPTFSTGENEQDRQVIAEAHKEEADELFRRCVSTACCGILLGLLRRDPLRLFAEPVPPSVEGYAKIVKRPIDFGIIRRRVLKGRYTNLKSFVQDARLLCANALVFNPEGSIYAIAAKDIYESLESMQKRASQWISSMRNIHAAHFAKFGRSLSKEVQDSQGNETTDHVSQAKGPRNEDDMFRDLRVSWPGGADVLEQSDYFRSQIRSDFLRTRENEVAYYGTLAVRRIAAAAEASLATLPDMGGVYQPCVRRHYKEDEALREHIDAVVAAADGPVQLKDDPSWREESVLRFLRNVQSRRIEARTSSESGCARCDGVWTDAEEAKLAMREATMRKRRRTDGVRSRVHESRIGESTGLASANARERVANEARASEDTLRNSSGEAVTATARDKSVSVRGSRIHGWGLYTDHPFKRNEIVAEYVGEYVGNAVADAREKMYQRMRIQDYQFRVSNDLVIDATLKGGHARYINHSCDPNCAAKIIDGKTPNKHLKRVIIVSQRNIPAMEEITYDYQFPLELDLSRRIPCNCGSKLCRGFMNWDLPEVGSKTTRYQMMKASRARDRVSRKSSGRSAGTRQTNATNG